MKKVSLTQYRIIAAKWQFTPWVRDNKENLGERSSMWESAFHNRQR